MQELPHRARGGVAQGLRDRAASAFPASSATAGTFTQKLDHFDPSVTTTFAQRYWINDTFFSSSSNLVFLNICGEGPCGPPGWWMSQLAMRHDAMMASLEHRFYGDSVPGDKDFSTETLHHLNVANVLADLNAFIANFPGTPSGSSPASLRFFTVGGSYSGALSAWFREVYPNATLGSLSASGVVNALELFPEFDEQVAESAGKDCTASLIAIRAAFENEFAKGNGDAMKDLFHANHTMSTPDFFYMIADSGAMAVQYGHMPEMCGTLPAPTADNATLISGFADFTNTFWGKDFGDNCFYNTQCLKDDPAKWQPTNRAWRWQKCYELAYFQVAPKSGSIRSSVVDLEYHLSQCETAFGISGMKPATDKINAWLGGAEPKESKVYYAQGSQDPWQRAGVSATLSATQPEHTAVCDTCGHCGVMETYAQSAAVEESRSMFYGYLSQWLK